MSARLAYPPYAYVFKVSVLGDSGVGKTGLIGTYIEGKFHESTVPTIGLAFHPKTILRAGGTIIKLQIWDTAGQEKYRSLSNHLFRGSSGFFLVFDTTSIQSFECLVYWLDLIDKNALPHSSVLVVGTKCEMEMSREVPKNAIDDFCQERGLQYVETSSRSLINVDLAFEKMIDLLLTKDALKVDVKSDSGTVSLPYSTSSESQASPCSC